MGLTRTLLRGATSTVALGVGTAIAIPLALPVLTSEERRRALAKKAIKSCIALSDRVKESVESARAQFSTLVAEARAELQEETHADSTQADPADAPDVVDRG